MKKHFLLLFLFPLVALGQSLFSNAITGVNPNVSNPFSSGQIVDSNIVVSGIGRGVGVLGKNANNRYDATGWNSALFDPMDYFEFKLTPSLGKKIDFVSFVYNSQVSINGPALFSFRSSLDGFSTNIGTVSATGQTVSLSTAAFQNITRTITFRLYGWAAKTGTGTFSVNSFIFNGTVDCAIPEIPNLNEAVLSCSSTSFDLNWNASFNAAEYSLDIATDEGFIDAFFTYTNFNLGNITSKHISGLLAGRNYYVRLRAKNECGFSDYSNVKLVSPLSTTYSDGLWSNGLPDSSKKVIFSSDYVMAANLEACSCIIDSGVSVGVNDGVILKLENGLEIFGTGKLTFDNNSSLVQVNNAAVNSGPIFYKRNTSPMKNFDYTYWSSPVKDQILNVLSPNTFWDKYLSYSMNKWIVESGTNKMMEGKGYIIRVPKPQYWPDPTAATYVQSVQFEGIPNNGIYTCPIDPIGYSNLIGNPYPSALNADAFLLENAINNNRLEGTIYFWTHTTAITNNKYSGTDFASYNALGGVAAGSGGEKPSGSIAVGQSFVTKSAGLAGPVVFNNSMRDAAPNRNSQFFKGIKPKTNGIDKHRVWLNLTHTDGAFKQLLLGYASGATNGADVAFDGVSLNNNKYIDFYSINEGRNLTIQGRALPFKITDIVPLGFKTTMEGAFAIRIDESDGIFSRQSLFLEDKMRGIFHDLKKEPYLFTTLIGVFNDRFVLHYRDCSALASVAVGNLTGFACKIKEGITAFDANDPYKTVFIFSKNGQIVINSTTERIAKISIYDVRGRQLYEKDNINSVEYDITTLESKKQLLIIVTVLNNGKKQSSEIIF